MLAHTATDNILYSSIRAVYYCSSRRHLDGLYLDARYEYEYVLQLRNCLFDIDRASRAGRGHDAAKIKATGLAHTVYICESIRRVDVLLYE